MSSQQQSQNNTMDNLTNALQTGMNLNTPNNAMQQHSQNNPNPMDAITTALHNGLDLNALSAVEQFHLQLIKNFEAAGDYNEAENQAQLYYLTYNRSAPEYEYLVNNPAGSNREKNRQRLRAAVYEAMDDHDMFLARELAQKYRRTYGRQVEGWEFAEVEWQEDEGFRREQMKLRVEECRGECLRDAEGSAREFFALWGVRAF